MPTVRVRQLGNRLLSVYDAVQVELHGQYSLARLAALTQYSALTSIRRAAIIVVLTPLPCLFTILLLDAVPLHAASAGVQGQTVWLWVRVAFSTIVISFCTIQQLCQSTPSLPMSPARLAVILFALGVAGTAEFYALGVLVGFPTPFAMQLIMMLWFPKISTALWLSWRRALEQDAVARRQLTRYLVAQSSEVAIALVYPVYHYVFTQLSGSQQTVFSLVLPVLKLGFKNWVSYGVVHMEDLAPMVIVFNIDVFHALFLSTTTQTSKSMGTVAIVMAVDVLQACVALVQVHQVMGQYNQAHTTIQKIVAAHRAPAPGVAASCSFAPLASVQHIVATCPRVCTHPDLALPRHLRLRPQTVAVPVAVAGGPSAARCLSISVNTFPNGFTKVAPASQLMLPPRQPTKHGSPRASPPLTELERLQVQSVARMLKVLHMVESYVLIEFAEFVMAAIYAIYLFAMASLPNRVHYANLATLTSEQLRTKAEYVALYAVMELISFLVLCYLFDKKLHQFSTIRQLAFVLQNHRQMAQASLVLWVLFVVQLPLAHSATEPMLRMLIGRVRQLGDRLLHAYDALQVELHGQYSLARLAALRRYNDVTSLPRAVAIVVLTPLPCLLTVLLLDVVPIHAASAGVQGQTVWLWVRVAFSTIVISFCTIQQLCQSTPSLPMSPARLAVILFVLGVAGTAEFYALGVLVGFPTPFAMQLIMMLWFPKITTALWLSWRQALQQDAVARGQLTRYLIAQSSEVAIALVYPVYHYVFTQLSGSQQTVFSLVVPVLKLGFKNWVSYGVVHMEDLAPVVIVFNIDVFHALFLSTTTQTSKSMGTVAIVMAVDVLQTCVSYYQVHQVRGQYTQAFSPLASVQHIVATCPRVCTHPDLALPRHMRLYSSTAAVAVAVRSQPSTCCPFSAVGCFLSNGSTRVLPASQLMLLPPPPPTKIGSSSVSPPLTELTERERLQIHSVSCVLKVLHMVEFYVLIEFAEFAMAAIYALYLVAMASLPSRVHYANLATLTSEQLRANALQVRQLAYVLQNHWQMAQAALVLWVLFVVQLPLAHCGTDYSFQFAWLNRKTVSSNMLLSKKDDSGIGVGASGTKQATAAAVLCTLCDLYTRNDLDGKWTELTKVYEQRKNEDNLREILDLSAPNKRMNDLSVWHLERMAVGELGGEMGAASGDIAVIKQESRRTRHVLRKILANGEKYRQKREELVASMAKQRQALITELEAAKEFLGQIHSAESVDSDVVQLTTPAPVEERLLATVKPPEAAANVDLSAAPSI